MDYGLLTTEILTLSLACLLLVIGLVAPSSESRRGIGYLTLFGLVAIFLFTCKQYYMQGTLFNDMFRVDGYAIFFKQIFLVAAAMTVMFSMDFVDRLPKYHGEFYACIVFALLGMEAMASANDLISVYVAMELMTITFFVLVGYMLGNAKSSEAGIKYLMLGAASSAIILYGISLIYGLTGTVILPEIVEKLTASPATLVGILFILAGFGFKISAVPFHMWSPDVYEGAPAPVTAFLAMASKAAGFAVLVRTFMVAFPDAPYNWLFLIVVLATLSMVIGNLVAIPQTNIKRMLAFSSVAQAGYILIGMVANNELGVKGILFYSMLYVFANVGAFAVVSIVSTHRGSDEIADYAGLAQKAPLLATVMTVALLSMAGIPPLAGFVGKFYLFAAIIEQGKYWLATLGFVMSMISVYYYLNVTLVMFRDDPKDDKPMLVSGPVKWALYSSMVLTLFFGVYPGPLAELATFAARSLFMF